MSREGRRRYTSFSSLDDLNELHFLTHLFDDLVYSCLRLSGEIIRQYNFFYLNVFSLLSEHTLWLELLELNVRTKFICSIKLCWVVYVAARSATLLRLLVMEDILQISTQQNFGTTWCRLCAHTREQILCAVRSTAYRNDLIKSKP